MGTLAFVFGLKKNGYDEFVLESKYSHTELKMAIQEKYEIPESKQIIHHSQYWSQAHVEIHRKRFSFLLNHGTHDDICQIEDYYMTDSRKFEIIVKGYGEYEKCLLQLEYSYISGRWETFHTFQTRFEDELPIEYQIFEVFQDACYERVIAENEDSLTDVYKKNGGDEGGCLTLYLTSKKGYTGKGATFECAVKVKPFGASEPNEVLLENDFICNTLYDCRDFFQLIKDRLQNAVDIPESCQILTDPLHGRIDLTEYMSIERFRKCNIINGEMTIYLSVDVELMDEKIKDICEKYHIYYWNKTFSLKSLTRTEDLEVKDSNFWNIYSVRKYINRTRGIPREALQYMVNNAEVCDLDSLSDLFYKQQKHETYSLKIFTVVRIFNVCVTTADGAAEFIKVSELDTISELEKKIVESSDNLPRHIAIYTTHGTLLEEGKTMVEYGLKDSTTLRVEKRVKILIHSKIGEPSVLYVDNEDGVCTMKDLIQYVRRRMKKECKRKQLRLRNEPTADERVLSHYTDTIPTNEDELQFDLIPKPSQCPLQ